MTKRVTFHAASATVMILLVLVALVQDFLSPVDLFVHSSYLLIGHFQLLLAAFVFYGFSLLLLRLVPLPKFWSVAYTVLSWLFFWWAFYPTRDTSGMMRRIAGTTEDYMAAQRTGTMFHVGGIFMFGFIQAVYLLYVVRTIRHTTQASSAEFNL